MEMKKKRSRWNNNAVLMFKKTMLDRIQHYKRTVPVLPCSALISNLLSSNYEIRIYNESLKFSRLMGPPDTWVLSNQTATLLVFTKGKNYRGTC